MIFNEVIVDYFLRVEFQSRGAPHAHFFIWLRGPIDVNAENEAEKVRNRNYVIHHFIDHTITTDLINEEDTKGTYWNTLRGTKCLSCPPDFLKMAE